MIRKRCSASIWKELKHSKEASPVLLSWTAKYLNCEHIQILGAFIWDWEQYVSENVFIWNYNFIFSVRKWKSDSYRNRNWRDFWNWKSFCEPFVMWNLFECCQAFHPACFHIFANVFHLSKPKGGRLKSFSVLTFGLSLLIFSDEHLQAEICLPAWPDAHDSNQPLHLDQGCHPGN